MSMQYLEGSELDREARPSEGMRLADLARELPSAAVVEGDFQHPRLLVQGDGRRNALGH